MEQMKPTEGVGEGEGQCWGEGGVQGGKQDSYVITHFEHFK